MQGQGLNHELELDGAAGSPAVGSSPELLRDEILSTWKRHPAPCQNFFLDRFGPHCQEGMTDSDISRYRQRLDFSCICRDCQHQSPIATERSLRRLHCRSAGNRDTFGSFKSNGKKKYHSSQSILHNKQTFVSSLQFCFIILQALKSITIYGPKNNTKMKHLNDRNTEGFGLEGT